ncbi:MAG: 3D domain-containing protein [Candidatus Wallbacteria bacterium]|nr:3D domain-containing protein [Candidatus Wallbacteria bacterium]
MKSFLSLIIAALVLSLPVAAEPLIIKVRTQGMEKKPAQEHPVAAASMAPCQSAAPIVIHVTRRMPVLPAKESSNPLYANLSRFIKIHGQIPTLYHTVEERHFDDYRIQEIVDKQNRTISVCKDNFYRALCRQGSGILEDGRAVSIVGKNQFHVLPKNCLGITSSGNPVIPFHTLAVDPEKMPLGSVYYIPRTRGLKLPDGSTHDGFWFAHDTGAAFRGSGQCRIDLYVGNSEGINFMGKHGIRSFRVLQVYKVDDSTRRLIYDKYRVALSKVRK